MNSLSLARIMYGTNEVLHVPMAISAVVLPPFANLTRAEFAVTPAVSAHGTLGEFLQKAWAALRK